MSPVSDPGVSEYLERQDIEEALQQSLSGEAFEALQVLSTPTVCTSDNPIDSYTEDRTFFLMLHIIRNGDCIGGISNSVRDDLVDQVRGFLGQVGFPIPEEEFERNYVAVREICNGELYTRTLEYDAAYDIIHDAAIGTDAFQNDYPDDGQILHVTTGKLDVKSAYSQSFGLQHILLDNDYITKVSNYRYR